MRHTYATQLIMRALPLSYVAAQVGHKSVAMVEKTYSKWLRQDGGHAKRKLDATFCPTSAPARTQVIEGVGRRDWTRTNDPHHVKVVL